MSHSTNNYNNNMANNDPPSPTNRRQSLLDAASALASLGYKNSATSASSTLSNGPPSHSYLTAAERQLLLRNNPSAAAYSHSSTFNPSATASEAIATKEMSRVPSMTKPKKKAPAAKKPSKPRNRSDVPMPFPERLMEVLSNEEISDIITWLPHGKGFAILKKNKFASEVLPVYFKQSKYTSFTRKLKRWGFTRVTSGTELGAYYHKFFQRGNHLLCMQMHCSSTGSPAFDKDLQKQHQLLQEEKLKAEEEVEEQQIANLKEEAAGIASSLPEGRKKEEDVGLGVYKQDLSGYKSNDIVPSSTNVPSDGIMLPSSQGQVAASRAGSTDRLLFDQVLSRQRELLEADRNQTDRQSYGFGSVFDRQQQLLRTSNNNGYLPSDGICGPCVLPPTAAARPPPPVVDPRLEAEMLFRRSALASRSHDDLHRYVLLEAYNALKSKQQEEQRQRSLSYERFGEEANAAANFLHGRSFNNLREYETADPPNNNLTNGNGQNSLSTMRAQLHQMEEHNKRVEEALKVVGRTASSLPSDMNSNPSGGRASAA